MLITILDLLSRSATFVVSVSIFSILIAGIFFVGEKTRNVYVFGIRMSDIISIIIGILIIINFFEISSPYK